MFEKTSKTSTNAFILTIVILLLIYVCSHNVPVIGESEHFMIMSITLENHCSLDIRDVDIKQSQYDFPNHFDLIYDTFKKNPQGSTLTSFDGKVYSWYLGTYSLFCLPVKIFLKTLGADQSYAFVITNVLMLGFVVLCALNFLPSSLIHNFIIGLMLIFSPALFYLRWPSYEVFIFSTITLSLLCLINKRYCLSAFLVSLAATLNPTVMAYGMIIPLCYLYELYETKEFKLTKKLIGNCLLLGICFSPSIYLFAFNYFNFGFLNPQLAHGYEPGSLIMTINRFVAYLLDLNFGFLPYYPLLTILIIYIFLYSCAKKQVCNCFLCIGFLGTVFAYSFMPHINCGMTGISRYNAWSYPILLLAIYSYFKDTSINTKKYRVFFSTTFLTLLLFLFVAAPIIVKFDTPGYRYVDMLPVARHVLDTFPRIYNPLFSTFISRVKNIDGGYTFDRPVIYTSTNGYIRKILVTPSTAKYVEQMVDGTPDDLKKLSQKINKISNKTGFQYINIPSHSSIIESSTINYSISSDSLTINGIYNDKSKSIKSRFNTANHLHFGPYSTLPPGKYDVKFVVQTNSYDSNFKSELGFVEVVSDFGNQQHGKIGIFSNKTDYIIEFQSPKGGLQNIEYRVFSYENSDLELMSIKISRK